MRRILLISDTRTGSTALADTIARSLAAADLGEIFFPLTKEAAAFPGYEFNFRVVTNFSEDQYHKRQAIADYFAKLCTIVSGSFIAKVVYHDLCIGLSHPARLDGSFPVFEFADRAFTEAIHLVRRDLAACAISDLAARQSGIHHQSLPTDSRGDSSREARHELSGNGRGIVIRPSEVLEEFRARRRQQAVVKMAFDEYLSVPKRTVYYEETIGLSDGKWVRQLFPEAEDGMGTRFVRMGTTQGGAVENINEIMDQLRKAGLR